MSWQLADALLMPGKCYSVYTLVHFRLNRYRSASGSESGSGPDLDLIRIQGFDDKIEKYLQLKKLIFF
jgi:hypothetical protein